MTTLKIALRSIKYYMPLAIIISLGVAIATAVIIASIITGSSFQASLSRYLSERRGNINSVVQTSSLFPIQLSKRISSSIPILSLNAAGENSYGSVVPGVKVYGINNDIQTVFPGSFSEFPDGRNVIINSSIANDLNLKNGEDIFLSFQKISDINKNTLFADRSAYENTIKLKFKIKDIIPNSGAGSFVISGTSLQPAIIYIDYTWLSKRLNIENKINVIISTDKYEDFYEKLMNEITAYDIGIFNDEQFVYFKGVLFPDSIIKKLDKYFVPISTYLADELKFKDKSTSYIMISDNAELFKQKRIADNEIILLKWAADDINAKIGDVIDVKYQYYMRDGTFSLKKIRLTVTGILSDEVPYLNSKYSPQISGVTDVDEIGAWDAPFPFDNSRVTQRDELYWKLHRAAPRAFVSNNTIKLMWQQEGSKDWVTTLINTRSISLDKIVKSVDLKYFGILPVDYHQLINIASSGKTDMTSLLISTGVFIIISAVLFALLFMQLMVDYRKKQIGICIACGLSIDFVKKQFMIEGAIISVIGILAGVYPGIFFSYLLIEKFNSVWNISGSLKIFHSYHLSDVIIATVFVFMLMLFVISMQITRKIKFESIISLIYNGIGLPEKSKIIKPVIGYLLLTISVLVFLLSIHNIMGRFSAAMLALVALILIANHYFSQPSLSTVSNVQIVKKIIQANLKRVMLIIIMISSSVFILLSTATFIKTDKTRNELSNGSGFTCRIDFPEQPAFSLASPDGRKSAGFDKNDELELKNTVFTPLLSNIGDDISCVSNDKPTSVKILGITPEMEKKSGNTYHYSSKKRNHIWVDEETLYWSLKYMGGKGSIPLNDGRSYSFLSATAMLDSIFGSEVLISESDFRILYPQISIPSVYMVSISGDTDKIIQLLRTRLGPLGATVRKTSDILKSYHNVQNGYIEIFINFSIIGLLLGLFAHQAIIFRTIWEMRKEIAIMHAIGLSGKDINQIFMRFISLITIIGAVIGVLSSLITVLPAISANLRLIPLLISTLVIMIIYIVSCFTIILAIRKVNSGNTIELLRSE